jgi:PAS domain S-box-containing protein
MRYEEGVSDGGDYLMVGAEEDRTHIILDSIAEGVFTVDADWKITSFNRGAEKITGIKRSEAIGRHCWDVFRANICENRCALRQTMKTGKPIVNQSIFIINSKGDLIPISISTALLKNDSGQVVGGVETFRDLSVVEELRKELAGRHSFLDIISKNSEMQRLFSLLEQVSESNATVLLVGESGTGKELFAKAIHSLSMRKEGPIVTINCGALPDNLLESELFGYKAGAFTDAKRDKPGRLALAEGGTVFLDEIGDISPALQVRLLRVLQDKMYEPLGSTKSVKADVRIVAATHRDLENLVSEGVFRQDLYYRINVVKLVLPPLRERKEDIPLLADHFIRKFNRFNAKEIQGLSPDVLPLLMTYDFPGNIRELENIIEYATVVCKDLLIGIEHLPDHFRNGLVECVPVTPARQEVSKGASWAETERNFVYEALTRNNWNRSATADEMGIHTTTLWRKMKRLNIESPSKDM